MQPSQDTATTRKLSQSYQDHLIGQLLPAWLRQASPAQLSALQDAMTLSLYFRQRVSEILQRLEGIDRFAELLLVEALHALTGVPLDVRQSHFRQGRREPVVVSQPIGYPVTELVYGQVPLLEAALRNFDAEQASEGGQYPLNAVLDAQGQPLSWLSASQFANCCRTLDLGARYQQHLDSVLLPGDADERRSVHSLLARAQRYAMLADAHVAHIKGALNEAELQLLVRLCGLHSPLSFEGSPVQLKRLKLLGCELEQIVVVDIRDEHLEPLRSTSLRVLVYVPGDPVAPWRVCPSLRQLANDLGRQLRTPGYQRFFSRFVRRRDSQRFFSQVISGFAGVGELANIDLGEHMQPWPGPLFDSLAQARIAQIKDDAALIAVPVAAIDLALQREHDQRLAAEGWALLNLAGLFVPGVGLALLAVSAWELLAEVYHGIEAWHEGDSSEAFDHLINVASDLAIIAATAAGASVVSRAWTRATQVDALVPVTLENATTRLWNPDLAAYRVEAPPTAALRDVQGVYRLDDQAWVAMGRHSYAVRESVDGNWRLSAHNGLAPELRHNGAGAWRVWTEQPQEWADTSQLFQRLGAPFDRLDETQISQVLASQGIGADYLRALHVHGLGADAQVLDSVARHHLDQRIRDLRWALAGGAVSNDAVLLEHARALYGQTLADSELARQLQARRAELFERVYQAEQGDDDADAVVLRRQFPSLHGRAAAELLRNARVVDRQRLRDSGRVPLRLAQAAREAVANIRISRAYDGLYLGVAQGADLARVSLGLSPGLYGAPSELGWRLYEGSQDGPLLLAVGEQQGEHCFELFHLQGRFTLQDARGQVLSGPGELFTTMAAAYDPAQRQAMLGFEPFADHLRAELGSLALERRAEVQRLLGGDRTLGWFRPPQRLADGRLGYPLSGRGSGQRYSRALMTRIRDLYPTFSDEEIDAWLIGVRDSGRDVSRELDRLESERNLLRRHLIEWAEQPGSMTQRLERHGFADALRNCWHRRTNRLHDHRGQPRGYRLSVWATTLRTLPELPAQVSFSHVHELSLMAMGLEDVPLSFLRSFPQLRVLELANNSLTRLPAGLNALLELRELDLFDNNIRLDAEQAHSLAGCVSLEFINLSHNPLGRTFPLHRMGNLRRLHMRGTDIDELPPALLDRLELTVADLRDNRITGLPERFYRAPGWLSSTILLQENPFEVAEAVRYAGYLEAHGLSELHAGLDSAVSPRRRWLDSVGNLQRAERSAGWDELEGEEGSDEYFALLTGLLETVDFQRNRRALSARVFSMQQAMREHTELREALFTQAALPRTCQDSVALAFSGLELRMLVWRASVDAQAGGQEAALLHLGRQLWRLDEVDRIALADIQQRRASGSDPDEIEVGLAYRLALRDELDLPAQPGDMAFGEVAGLDQARIDRARSQVLSAQTDEQLAQSLVQRTFWQEHLVRAYAERFTALDMPFHERLEVLSEAIDTMPEGEYLSGMNAVNDERQAARLELMRVLTLEVLAAQP
ncbi:NEL-type E3 ubiquitin ligase domain-containing protein [Pseudomonas sp. NPDC089554]|uniref:NEL-type E3 ubiquitin ligase domain-containing protein n=1 Tax=Pseudomonas sp. NPDC089554 TaxID=3390653 RepID=UPI003CFBF777